MKFSRFLASTLFLMAARFIFPTPAVGHEIGAEIRWTRSLSTAKARAASERKLIVADIYADWCGWCKQMDAKTWVHPSVVGESGKYVFLKLNAEKEPDGIELRRKFSISGFPTVLILESDGNEFERLEGYLPGQKFLDRLNEVIADPDSLGNLRAEVRRTPENLEVQFKLGKKLLSRYEFTDAKSRFREVARRDPKNRSRLADKALFYLALCELSQNNTKESLVTIDQLNRDFPNSEISPDAMLLSSEILIRMGRHDDAKQRIQGFLKLYPDHPLAPRAITLLSSL